MAKGGPGYGTCTQVTPECPIQATVYGSYFNLGGNVFFAIIFGLALVAHIFLELTRRTFAFSSWVVIGCMFEVMGYISRSVMVAQPWSLALLSLQICGLLWGPTLMSAGISIMCKRIIDYCGQKYSVLPAKLVPYVFIGTDVLTVVIQGMGGILASVGTGKPESNIGQVGTDLMIAGVSFQVAHMILCGIIMIIYFWRYRRDSDEQKSASQITEYAQDKLRDTKARRRLKWFCSGLTVAYIGVLTRSIYRVPEMAGGWANPIMRDEVSFFFLDSMVISIAMISLIIFHPGLWFLPFIKKTRPVVVGDEPKNLQQRSDSSDSN